MQTIQRLLNRWTSTLTLVLITGVLTTVHATTFKPVRVPCPVCKTIFPDIQITSTNGAGGMDSDFCDHAFGMSPQPHYVWTCPSCLYSNWAGNAFFGDMKEETRRKVLGELKSDPFVVKLENRGKIASWLRFHLAAMIQQWNGADDRQVAQLYLEGAWAVRTNQIYLGKLGSLDTLEHKISDFSIDAVEGIAGDINHAEVEVTVARMLLNDLRKGGIPPPVAILQEFMAGYMFRNHGENHRAAALIQRVKESHDAPNPVKTICDRLIESIQAENIMLRKAASLLQRAIQNKIPSVKNANWHSLMIECHGDNPLIRLLLLADLHRRTGEPGKAAEAYQLVLKANGCPAFFLRRAEEGLEDLGDGYRLSDEDKRVLKGKRLDAITQELLQPRDHDIEWIMDWLKRKTAIEELGYLKDSLVPEKLMEPFRVSGEYPRRAMALALGGVPDPSGAIDNALVKAMNDDPSDVVRAAAAQSLVGRRSTKGLDALKKVIFDAPEGVCLAALEAIGRRGDPADVPLLLKVQNSTTGTVQQRAIETIGLIGDGNTVPLVLERYNDFPRAAGIALSRLTNTRFWSEVDTDKAVSAMAEFPDPPPEAIVKFREWRKNNLGRPREEWVVAGFQEAGYEVDRLDDRKIIPVLVRILEDEHHGVRYNALRVLLRLTGESFGWSGFINPGPKRWSESERKCGIRRWKRWLEGNPPKQ